MSRKKTSAGGSRFGFLIAVIVCAYAGWAIYQYMPLRTQSYEFREKVKEVLKFSGVEHQGNISVEEMRQLMMKKAKELRVPLLEKNLDVVKDENKWRVTAHWEVPYKIPGYGTTIAYSIDESWTNY